MQRDGYKRSLWQDTSNGITGDSGALPREVLDVVIVGAGITGLSTALALRQAGLSCLVAEAHTIGFGTTGGTSAHVNTILDLTYDRMISKFGEDDAKLVARGTVEAMYRIKAWAERYAPRCNFGERDAFMFAKDEKQAGELEKIVEATRKMGLPVSWSTDVPTPRTFVKAARFSEQGQLHPTRYLHGIATAFVKASGHLRLQCPVMDVEAEKEHLKITTGNGAVHARHLVYATHIPPGVNILHFRNAPYRSYVLAARLSKESELPEALVYDMEDPYHYYRTEEVNGERFLIAGGYDHKTGEEDDTEKRFNQLDAHVRAHYSVKAISHQWSSQYFEPTDGLPYIGKLPMADDRIYVATGYNGNGITLGTLASIVLTDLIGKGQSAYEKVFDPTRVSVVAGFANFMKEAADVVGHLIAAPFPAERLEELSDLAKDEGRVVQHDGKSIAMYRDDQGHLHAVDPACSHIKCTVAWNSAERSWDCPCHGSRFSPTGEVLCGPARKPLQRISVRK